MTGSNPQFENTQSQGDDNARQLVLVKGGQRYVFRCEPGREAALLDSLANMARDPQNDLDWFDAAVLSHQMGQHLGKQLQDMTPHQ